MSLQSYLVLDAPDFNRGTCKPSAKLDGNFLIFQTFRMPAFFGNGLSSLGKTCPVAASNQSREFFSEVPKKEPKRLDLHKEWISQEKSTFEFVVDEKPTFAGIDLYNKLIDRDPADNLVEVETPKRFSDGVRVAQLLFVRHDKNAVPIYRWLVK